MWLVGVVVRRYIDILIIIINFPYSTCIYCKTLNISVPLMLAKLAMRYHSLTFVDAKINVYRYACAVVCHVVSKAENGVLPVQLVAGKQLSLLLPSCDNPCSTSAGNRSIEQVRAKEGSASQDRQARVRIRKHLLTSIVCLTLLLAVCYQFNRSDIAEYIRPQRLADGIVKRAKFNGR